MQEKQYYLTKGRLDLSLLDEHREAMPQQDNRMMPYKDDAIESIFKEMGNLFDTKLDINQ